MHQLPGLMLQQLLFLYLMAKFFWKEIQVTDESFSIQLAKQANWMEPLFFNLQGCTFYDPTRTTMKWVTTSKQWITAPALVELHCLLSAILYFFNLVVGHISIFFKKSSLPHLSAMGLSSKSLTSCWLTFVKYLCIPDKLSKKTLSYCSNKKTICKKIEPIHSCHQVGYCPTVTKNCKPMFCCSPLQKLDYMNLNRH